MTRSTRPEVLDGAATPARRAPDSSRAGSRGSPAARAGRSAWPCCSCVLLLWRVLADPGVRRLRGPHDHRRHDALAFLAMAQTVIVISGGIDLSVGGDDGVRQLPRRALWMEDQGFGACLAHRRRRARRHRGLLAAAHRRDHHRGLGRARHHRHARRQLHPGRACALFVHRRPGRRHVDPTSSSFVAGGLDQPLAVGAVDWSARSLLVWVPLRRSRLGLAIYAVGSNRNAAFLSGVDDRPDPGRRLRDRRAVRRVRRPRHHRLTGGGEPRATIGANATLNSVAAVVLGGVALTGGVGGLRRPGAGRAVPDADPGDHARPRLGPEQRRDGPRRDHHPRRARRRPAPGPAGGRRDDRSAPMARATADRAESAPGAGRRAARPASRERRSPAARSCCVVTVLYASRPGGRQPVHRERRPLDPAAGLPAGDLRRQPDAVHADRRDRPVDRHDRQPRRLRGRQPERAAAPLAALADGAGASAWPSAPSTASRSGCSRSTR